jgi:hypothetical protein
MNKNWKERTIQYAIKYFWKIILIVLAAGIAIAGFSFRIGPFQCDKEGIQIPTQGGVK